MFVRVCFSIHHYIDGVYAGPFSDCSSTDASSRCVSLVPIFSFTDALTFAIQLVVTNLYNSRTACPATATGALSSDATFVVQLQQNNTRAEWDSNGSGVLKAFAASVE